MRRMKMAVVTTFVMLLSSVGVVLATSQSASAAYNCSTGTWSNGYVWGKCLTGEPNGNYYRVNIVCSKWFGSVSYTQHGTIVHVNSSTPSTIVRCQDGGTYSGSPWIQTMWGY